MNDSTFQGNGKVAYVPVVVNAKPPKLTNADRIRRMTDEELADLLNDRAYPTKVWEGLSVGAFESAYDAWLWWLKQEAKE